MRTHAVSRHAVPPGSARLMRYTVQCHSLSKSGLRKTSKRKVLQLMGTAARSAKHYRLVRRVLKGHMITVGDASSPVGDDHEEHVDGEDTEDVEPRARSGGRPARTTKKEFESTLKLTQFDATNMCDVATRYKQMNSGREASMGPDTVSANARMVDRFFSWAMHNTSYEEEGSLLLCTDRPVQFLTAMRKVAAPNTLRNYCNAMLSCIGTASTHAEFSSLFAGKRLFRKRLQQVAEVWSKLKNQYEKTARQNQRCLVRAGRFQNAPIRLILQYLCEFAEKFDEHVKEGQTSVNLSSPSDPLICAVACILALHGARLVCALNMKVSEVRDAATPTNNRHVIRVARHKTARFSGPAPLALTQGQYRLIKALADLRSRGDGEKRDVPLLPKLSGRACQVLFKDANAYLALHAPGVKPLTFNMIRKTVHSNEFLISGEAEGSVAKKNVSTYLCHGRGVASMHYTFRSDKAVVAEAASVEAVVATLAALDMIRDGTIPLPGCHGKYSTKFSSAKRVARILN